MQRTINVVVDKTTWPKPPALPAYPASFGAAQQSYELSIPAMLLTIGYLTTPTYGSGASLSAYWAWLRYLLAVSDDPALTLTREFYDLDAHQKTILSDDFGMGVPVCWLTERLSLGPIADGRYFVQRVGALIAAPGKKPTKRGPGKAPDFVAQDRSGIWHVIECKGTQSGSAYRDNQLGRRRPVPFGAVAQKRSVTFPPGYTGQRLACGLSIGVKGGQYASSLKIIDPPAEEEFAISKRDLFAADDAVARAAGARALRLAGFPAVSSVVSAPAGVRPTSRPTYGRAEKLRRIVLDIKADAADKELDERAARDTFQVDYEKYRGRSVELDLPAALDVGGRAIRRVRVRYGAGVDFIDELRRRPLVEEGFEGTDRSKIWREMVGATEIDSDTLSARLKIGSGFVAELDLKP